METLPLSMQNFSAEAMLNKTEYPVMKIRPDGYLDYTGFELDSTPEYGPYYFEVIDWKGWAAWMHRHWDLPIYASVIYVTLIFGIQAYLRKKPAFDLKRELFYWNGALGIFSMIGFARMAPEFLGVLASPNGFYTSVCLWQGGNMPTAFWGLLFTISKYVELGDTIFIVLRKKPLQFLQWYHHLVTLAVCHWTLPYIEPISRYYVVMNYGVHSLMYPYFALRALDVKVPRILANVITTLQLTQMIIGLGVNSYSGVKHFLDGSESCFRHPNSVKMFFIVYGSFAILFGQLFYKLVIRARRQQQAKGMKME